MASAGVLPETAVYRQSVEAMSEHTLASLRSAATDAEVEVALNRG